MRRRVSVWKLGLFTLIFLVAGGRLGAQSVSFVGARNFSVGGAPQGVAVGDFNGDGIPDIAITIQAFQRDAVAILLGSGDGTFSQAVLYQVDQFPRSITLGDFNNDGYLDVVTVNSQSISLMLGNGDGTFQPAIFVDPASSPAAVAVGDFNGDGRLDLAVTGSSFPAAVVLLLGNGNGTFQPARRFPIGSSSNSIVAGDFNGDGRLDVAVTQFS